MNVVETLIKSLGLDPVEIQNNGIEHRPLRPQFAGTNLTPRKELPNGIQ